MFWSIRVCRMISEHSLSLVVSRPCARPPSQFRGRIESRGTVWFSVILFSDGLFRLTRRSVIREITSRFRACRHCLRTFQADCPRARCNDHTKVVCWKVQSCVCVLLVSFYSGRYKVRIYANALCRRTRKDTNSCIVEYTEEAFP